LTKWSTELTKSSDAVVLIEERQLAFGRAEAALERATPGGDDVVLVEAAELAGRLPSKLESLLWCQLQQSMHQIVHM
jgi:hypothetical protein